MSLVLPPLYHWSPAENRERINRRGLKPTCPTGVFLSAPIAGPTPSQPMGKALRNQARYVDGDGSLRAVCLGTSPSHAWSLSGALFGEKGEDWDLWQVMLGALDEVHPLPFWGGRLDEVRVANRIPKRRLWLVGSRTA